MIFVVFIDSISARIVCVYMCMSLCVCVCFCMHVSSIAICMCVCVLHKQFRKLFRISDTAFYSNEPQLLIQSRIPIEKYRPYSRSVVFMLAKRWGRMRDRKMMPENCIQFCLLFLSSTKCCFVISIE